MYANGKFGGVGGEIVSFVVIMTLKDTSLQCLSSSAFQKFQMALLLLVCCVVFQSGVVYGSASVHI